MMDYINVRPKADEYRVLYELHSQLVMLFLPLKPVILILTFWFY